VSRRVPLPSASMAVSLTALVVAVGGSAYAASSVIDGAKLKNRSVTGSKLKNDTVTGKQIKESTLSTVPAAARALSAGHATSADLATNAGHAGSADNASALGGVGAAGFVQGQRISDSVAISETSTGSLQVPLMGQINLNCFNNGTLLPDFTNQTGATVQASVAVVDSSGTATAIGHTVAPGATLFAGSAVAAGQDHMIALWSGHSADLTLGWYLDGASSKCTVVETGIVH
jgi:hypothetical protein